MAENKDNLGNVVGFSENSEIKKKTPFSGKVNQAQLEEIKQKKKAELNEYYNEKPKPSKLPWILFITAFTMFIAILIYYFINDGTLYDIFDTILWTVGPSAGLFLVGYIIKKILML